MTESGKVHSNFTVIIIAKFQKTVKHQSLRNYGGCLLFFCVVLWRMIQENCANYFRISIDPVSIFFRVEEFELPKTHFFQNFITNENNTKDLNPRKGWGSFVFCVSHKMFTNSILQNKSISSPRGFEPAKSSKMSFPKSIHFPHQRTRIRESQN